MDNRDIGVQLLRELIIKLESSAYDLPLETELLDENYRVNKSCLSNWKENIDTVVRELTIKWLDKDSSLEEVMQSWANNLSEDVEFLGLFNRLGEIIDGWRKSLKSVFMKDESLYSMPVGTVMSEDVEGTIEEAKNQEGEESGDNEISDEEIN